MTQRDYLDHLAEVPLFAACARNDLKLIARRAENVHVSKGKELVTEGKPGHEFFVIASGQAGVKRKGKKIATLKKGDYFGELALLDRAPRNATVVAETEMELFILGQREFSGVLDEVPGLGHKLLAGMARRLREHDAKSVH
ncbi:MAG: cyclic nucleotide-binding domain-containing protein [Actinobacteria bacterium]|nr:cyclic nucleotide-binding domain-containing protein [Actinomycetota bacterium]